MIRCEGLGRRFADRFVVRDVSFAVERGEVVGLLGANGAGKSTIMRMISTLLRPDEGKAWVDGIEVREDPVKVRARLGYHTGETGLYERHTPRELLALFGVLHGATEATAHADVERWVEAFDMGAFADRPCGGLSTGQRQRVSLARTLMGRPAALLLDEPTSGLDLVSSRFILGALRALADEDHVAILYSTHLMAEVEILCDRIVVLHGGKVVASGTARELQRQTSTPSLAAAFLTLIGAEPLPSDAAEDEVSEDPACA